MKVKHVLSSYLVALFVVQSIASAGTIVLGETKTLSQPNVATQTSIEFYLDRTGADDGTPLPVGNYQVRVALSGAGAGSSVKILGIAPTVTHTQAFTLDTTNVTGGVSAYAATLNLASPFNIADGGGLLALNLELQPGASGNYTLSVLSGSGNTEFTSPVDFATLIPVDVGSGSVGVVVPEPISVHLGFLAMTGVLHTMRRRVAGRKWS